MPILTISTLEWAPPGSNPPKATSPLILPPTRLVLKVLPNKLSQATLDGLK